MKRIFSRENLYTIFNSWYIAIVAALLIVVATGYWMWYMSLATWGLALFTFVSVVYISVYFGARQEQLDANLHIATTGILTAGYAVITTLCALLIYTLQLNLTLVSIGYTEIKVKQLVNRERMFVYDKQGQLSSHVLYNNEYWNFVESMTPSSTCYEVTNTYTYHKGFTKTVTSFICKEPA